LNTSFQSPLALLYPIPGQKFRLTSIRVSDRQKVRATFQNIFGTLRKLPTASDFDLRVEGIVIRPFRPSRHMWQHGGRDIGFASTQIGMPENCTARFNNKRHIRGWSFHIMAPDQSAYNVGTQSVMIPLAMRAAIKRKKGAAKWQTKRAAPPRYMACSFSC
jgi:hypothetical protein